ncbi:fimbrial protein [Providencia rettgeri]|uniref:fimbrial protein n=1 Tax=Providencia rettgeri TaxID=587 RepID=UPI001F426E49|nr:fimbrial protein [Providencia rettgeri]
MMNIARILTLLSLFISTITQSDILINLEATLVRPACVITNENGDNELYINFSPVPVDRLTTEIKTFGILIKQCDLSKNLQIYLSPKEGSTFNLDNETVLETSITGLGIRFSEENKSTAINLLTWERIYPQINGDTGRISLQSQLVTNQVPEVLEPGPFRAALSVMIDYL